MVFRPIGYHVGNRGEPNFIPSQLTASRFTSLLNVINHPLFYLQQGAS
jgi:hypothetical protein